MIEFLRSVDYLIVVLDPMIGVHMTGEDMATALHNLAHRIERDQVTEGCWGGPSDGAIYELLVDPEMTHDLYHQKLREYLDSRPKRAA